MSDVASALVACVDRFPWWLWALSGMIGLMGTFALTVKGMRAAKPGLARS